MTWQMRDPFGEGIAGAISAYSGMQQAKQQKQQLDYEHQRQQEQDKQAAALSAAQIANYGASTAGTQATTAGTVASNAQNASLTDYRKHLDPKNWPKFKDDTDRVHFFQLRAADALAHGDTEAATQFRQMANDSAMDPNRLAQTDLTHAKTTETGAHAKLYGALTDKTKQWHDELQNRVKIESMRASEQDRRIAQQAATAAARMANSMQIAQGHDASAQERMKFMAQNRDILQLEAQDFVLNHKMKAEAAVRAAVQNVAAQNRANVNQYDQQMQSYRTSVTANQGSTDGLTMPSMPQVIQAPAQPLSVNVNAGGGGDNSSALVGALLSIMGGHKPDLSSLGGAGGGGGNDPDAARVSSEVQMARQALSQGVSPEKVRAKVATRGLSPHVHNEVLRQLGLTGGASASPRRASSGSAPNAFERAFPTGL